MYRRKIFIIFFLTFFVFTQNLSADEQTNLELLKAMMAQENGDETGAVQTYKKLYESSKEPAYLKEAIRLAFIASSPEFESLLNEGEEILKDDSEFIRIKAADLVNKKEFGKARELVKDLVKKEPNAQNIVLLGTICMMQGESWTALKYFEEAYKLNASEENVLRVADVLINRLDNVKEATFYLENFRQSAGCSIKTCEILADIYAQRRNFPKVVEIYEELYETSGDKGYLDKALQIFIYDKNYKAAIEFLKKYDYDDAVLMEIYAYTRNFGDAYVLASKLYNQTRNLDFLARAAMYEYEMHEKDMTDEKLKSVIEKFEDSAQKLDNAIYLNYYGYLLIDRDIDYKKGVALVTRALELEPGSPYYQDSLAWGYFKLGECNRAKGIMLEAMKDSEFQGSAEAKEHLRLIERCIINLNKRLKK